MIRLASIRDRRPATLATASMRTLSLLVLISLSAVACDRGAEQSAEPARSEAQEEAARRACIATALLRVSNDEVATIEATLQEGEEADGGALMQAQRAAARFARTLQEHAELRYAAFTHADSALNHARTSADSARYMESAGRFATRVPEAGTLERNVVDAYDRRFTEVYVDEDHRCNWDL